jgi:predicted RNA binding protein YcfA (HicA-like mRNA interferase family)/predicted RNase H-like HicB family nuclease
MDGKEVGFTVRLFREGETYVAHVPELDISSCGDTEAETRRNIKDAVAGFLNMRRSRGRSCKSSRKRAIGWMVGAGANRKSSRPSGCRSGLPDRKLVPVPYQTLVRIFEKDGFSLARQEGDHRIFTKAGVLRPLVIPTYPS